MKAYASFFIPLLLIIAASLIIYNPFNLLFNHADFPNVHDSGAGSLETLHFKDLARWTKLRAPFWQDLCRRQDVARTKSGPEKVGNFSHKTWRHLVGSSSLCSATQAAGYIDTDEAEPYPRSDQRPSPREMSRRSLHRREPRSFVKHEPCQHSLSSGGNQRYILGLIRRGIDSISEDAHESSFSRTESGKEPDRVSSAPKRLENNPPPEQSELSKFGKRPVKSVSDFLKLNPQRRPPELNTESKPPPGRDPGPPSKDSQGIKIDGPSSSKQSQQRQQQPLQRNQHSQQQHRQERQKGQNRQGHQQQLQQQRTKPKLSKHPKPLPSPFERGFRGRTPSFTAFGRPEPPSQQPQRLPLTSPFGKSLAADLRSATYRHKTTSPPQSPPQRVLQPMYFASRYPSDSALLMRATSSWRKGGFGRSKERKPETRYRPPPRSYSAEYSSKVPKKELDWMAQRLRYAAPEMVHGWEEHVEKENMELGKPLGYIKEEKGEGSGEQQERKGGSGARKEREREQRARRQRNSMDEQRPPPQWFGMRKTGSA